MLNVAEYLAFSEIVLYKSNSEIYSLNSGDIIEVFYNLRIDIEKLSYATTITKIIYDVTQENQYSGEILQLLLNTLYVLSETNKDPELVLAIFQLRLLAIIGYAPNIATCVNCGETMKESMEEFYFSIKDNGSKCASCSKQDRGSINLNKTSFAALIYILSAEAKKTYSFEIPKESINELKLLAQIYITEKLEKEYKVEKYT